MSIFDLKEAKDNKINLLKYQKESKNIRKKLKNC